MLAPSVARTRHSSHPRATKFLRSEATIKMEVLFVVRTRGLPLDFLIHNAVSGFADLLDFVFFFERR